MKKVLLILVGVIAAQVAWAHHSFAAEFDGNKPIRVDGTLVKVDWSNPHSYFYVESKDASSGKVTRWGCEGASPGALSRRGLQKGDARLGDRVIVDGYAAKDGSALMDVRRIYLNGKAIFGGSEGDGAPQQ